MTTTQQNTLQWYADRLGKITGSAVGRLMGVPRTKGERYTKTAVTYMHDVAGERMIAPEIVEDPELFAQYVEETEVSSRAIRIGHEREPEARDLYAAITGNPVTLTGSVAHPTLAGFASSPDGLIDADPEERIPPLGCLEIKCPTPTTAAAYQLRVHDAETLKTENAEYYWQCLAHMAVTGALWTDFCVYSPWLAKPLHIVRIERNEEAIATLMERVAEAEEYIENLIKRNKTCRRQ